MSNCGRHIIKSEPPAQKINIAYFEAWNYNRECSTMDFHEIDIYRFSHIHFAFAEVTKELKVDVSEVEGQFGLFKDIPKVKEIISFGGGTLLLRLKRSMSFQHVGPARKA